jgi:hypothetical protein
MGLNDGAGLWPLYRRGGDVDLGRCPRLIWFWAFGPAEMPASVASVSISIPSTEGAPYTSLGQRPRNNTSYHHQAPKVRLMEIPDT